MYEYACHEGNHALGGILAGARADEKKAAEEAAKKGTNCWLRPVSGSSAKLSLSSPVPMRKLRLPRVARARRKSLAQCCCAIRSHDCERGQAR